MDECVDGEYQDFKSKDGAYIRKHFFGRYPETAAMVEDWTDAEIWALTRGGHDPIKVYAAYKAAVEHKGQPTVILAKTVKGYGMGAAGEGQMIAHQAKKLGHDALTAFRDRFQIPVSDADLDKVPFLRFADDSDEMNYLRERRVALGGYLPARRRESEPLHAPPLSLFDPLLKATAEGREISTTMAFVRILTALCATRISVRMWFRSSPTKAEPSAWRGCSAKSASSARSASSTGRRTPISSCTTARTRRAKSSRKASTSRARWPPSSRQAHPIRRPTCR